MYIVITGPFYGRYSVWQDVGTDSLKLLGRFRLESDVKAFLDTLDWTGLEVRTFGKRRA